MGEWFKPARYSMERYSSWLRGGTANALGREIGAWVQVPFSPPTKRKGVNQHDFKNKRKYRLRKSY